MTLHRLSAGTGATRDVVLVYHVDPKKTGPSIVSACPDAVVGVEVFPPGGHYNPGKGVLPVADAVSGLRGGESWELGLLLLVGFSEGCQGVRSALLGGTDPSAVLAIDGIHASSPPAESQLAPWQAYCARAKEETRLAYLTHTQIDTTGYLPTKEVVPMVAGLSVVDTAWEWEDSEIPGGPHRVARDGFLWVGGWPGKDASAHVQQQVVVLPYLLEWLLVTARAHRGDLAAKVGSGGGGTPPPVKPVPGGGGGSRPPAGGSTKLPSGGSSKPPPAQQASSGGGGGGLLALAGLGLLGLAMGRKRR